MRFIKQIEKINKKVMRIAIVLSVSLLAIVGLTVAYYNSQKQFENEFHVKAPGVAVYEKFNPTDWWVPGEEKSKEVLFKNTGEMDMLLRFSLDIQWVDESGDPIEELGGLKPAEDVIELNWNIGENNEKGEDKKAKELGISTDVPVDFEKETQNGKDYYYYNKILKAGEKTDLVLESVKFITELSNDGHGVDYSNKQINLTIKGETVLADNAAVADQWKEVPQITAEINFETGKVTWSTNSN